MGVNTCYRANRAVPNEVEYCTTNPRHQFDISTNQTKLTHYATHETEILSETDYR